MTRRDKLLELAARVEALTEYDGRIMAEIDCTVLYPRLRPAEPDDHPEVNDWAFDPSSIWTPTGWLMSHNYFRSLDAAMTLCSQPPSFDIYHDHMVQGGKWVCLVGDDDDWVPNGRAEAATPALALTAACLRARAEK